MWGWEADESHSVSEALELFKREQYDLALCDVDLPDGNGIHLAKALSRVNPNLLVVLVSGNPANVAQAREAGFDRSLHKPFDLDALKALIAPRMSVGEL
jgi:DNA-binding response OmpR family regulator